VVQTHFLLFYWGLTYQSSSSPEASAHNECCWFLPRASSQRHHHLRRHRPTTNAAGSYPVQSEALSRVPLGLVVQIRCTACKAVVVIGPAAGMQEKQPGQQRSVSEDVQTGTGYIAGGGTGGCHRMPSCRVRACGRFRMGARQGTGLSACIGKDGVLVSQQWAHRRETKRQFCSPSRTEHQQTAVPQLPLDSLGQLHCDCHSVLPTAVGWHVTAVSFRPPATGWPPNGCRVTAVVRCVGYSRAGGGETE